MTKLEQLQQNVTTVLGGKVLSTIVSLGELTIVIDADAMLEVMQLLHDHQLTKFDQCVDLCGVDYSTYHDDYTGARFAVVYHLLSYQHNWRLRVRVFAKDDIMPTLPSLIAVFSSVNWYEREAFDLYGIIFINHPDLRRILTDYGFIGHPFRKDFPLSGHMEMIYDEEQKRVVYQPVTIEPREVIPRVIREDNYCGRN